VISNRGRPVAMLIPPEVGGKDAARAGREMLEYRDRLKRKLRGSFRTLAHEGHRT